MATITENIRRVHNGFPADEAKQAILLATLKKHAVAATIGGIDSPAARKYMSMFADSEDQLKLLTQVEDDQNRPWLHEAQAYVMANSICAPSTNGETGNGILDTPIEAGLNAIGVASVEESVLKERPTDFRTLFQ